VCRQTEGRRKEPAAGPEGRARVRVLNGWWKAFICVRVSVLGRAAFCNGPHSATSVFSVNRDLKPN
jgi:hypothetical protein